MRRKHILTLCAAVCAVLLLAGTSLALNETEVEAAVETAGGDALKGRVLIWFLCAIAFLKVSQKIDSFLSSLGLNVGRGGGSMLGELMIAGRAIGAAARNTGSVIGSVFNRGGGGTTAAASANRAAGETSFGGTGLAGVARRAVGKAAVGGGSGIRGAVGGAVFASSVKNNGPLAAGIVSTVARGSASRLGTISGPDAPAALSNYLGYGSDTPHDPDPRDAGDSFESHGWTAAQDSVPQEPPMFRDVEIGGGRITGYETAAGGAERRFAMYSATQYTEPEGDYDTVRTIDGEEWYRQYAEPAVQKTPYEDDGGRIRYEERIVERMPEIPKRKDRI